MPPWTAGSAREQANSTSVSDADRSTHRLRNLSKTFAVVGGEARTAGSFVELHQFSDDVP